MPWIQSELNQNVQDAFADALRGNGLLTWPDRRPRLPDNAMVALALLIAESDHRSRI